MECKRIIADSKIVLQDGAGKSKMCFNNPNNYKVQKITVDNCYIKEGKKCDFLIIDHKNVEHFVELKGKNIPHACEQLEETIKKISGDIKKIKFSFIVTTGCPLTNTEVQKFKVYFKNKFNCTLKVQTRLCEYNLG